MSNTSLNNHFSPKEIKSPNKDLPGIARTVFNHLTTLQGLLNDWYRTREKGTKLCKTISALKLYECEDDYYPKPLDVLMNSIVECAESFKNIVDAVGILRNQLNAVAKLQPGDQPAINTWTPEQISTQVDLIYSQLCKEYKLKQTITENLAHCRDEMLLEVYVSSWELELYLDSSSAAYLFADVGLCGKG